ncbi:hypothetical protein SeMB42_g00323 [Synchytrium endobioticum]|uniref:Uncharacterized protein n=1 Tax=Synchytrium endobioticum TaxID=286115 RepID=A0A507DRH5_9FUNG|nr:hypothetical protein SeLEV6574_g01859 [Synchytrium endobioticum]TPX54339.1 hypothetical protein SeMB42_g00323 [Synchytrium endobioticum]
MSALKSGRLKFKGDSSSTGKKKRKADDDPAGGCNTKSAKSTSSQATEGWVVAESEDDLLGPVFILSTTTDPPSVVSCNGKHHVALSLLENQEDATMDDITPSNAEPYDVSQVFVCNRVAGSSKVTLKSAFGKYLAADKFGVVACEREAAGNTEEWSILVRPDGIAFKSFWDTFLSAEYDKTLNDNEDDEEVGMDSKLNTTGKDKKKKLKKKDGVIRCDVDAVGFREVFTVKCQAAERAKRRNEAKGGQGIKKDLTIAEMEDMKRFQSWNKGRPIVEADVSLLKKAEREGNLHEVLLTRREKLKSDKFCK